MKVSWKRFNKIAQAKGWMPVFQGLQIYPHEHQVWTFREHPSITAHKPKETKQ